jgi:hypothetical protein
LGGAVSSDTKVSWTPVKGGGVTGYQIYTRRADELEWKRGAFVEGADASEAVLKGLIVDDHFVAVAAVNKQSESIVTFAGLPPRP